MGSWQHIAYALCAALLLTASGCGWDWSESYDYEDDDPFDLYALHQLLEARPAGLTTMEDSLSTLGGITAGNYVFVGNYAYYNERDITQLLDFVERGNSAFIAADELPEELAEMLFGSDCYHGYGLDYDNDYADARSIRDDTVSLTLEGVPGTFEITDIYYFKPIVTTYGDVSPFLLCDPELDNVSIGRTDSFAISYVRLKWGDGNFYFNTLPKFFTNYYLLDSTAYQYAEAALDVAIGPGPVYWDEASRIPPAVARQRRDARQNRNLQGRQLLSGNESLSYIQNQPPLALAWYLIVVAALLYVLFRGKRRQRIIPIIRQRENSSKRFIDTLSRLVFQKGNHAALAQQTLRNLRFYLQDEYNIRWKITDPLPADLAELTGADPELIRQADIELQIIRGKGAIDETALLRFHRAITPLFKLRAAPAQRGRRQPTANT